MTFQFCHAMPLTDCMVPREPLRRISLAVRICGEREPGKATIGIRPRAFAPVGESSSDTMTVTAELIEPMGAETLIHARGRAGEDIRVVVPRQMRIKTGEMMHLRADARQTHLFDDGGRAVRA